MINFLRFLLLLNSYEESSSATLDDIIKRHGIITARERVSVKWL